MFDQLSVSFLLRIWVVLFIENDVSLFSFMSTFSRFIMMLQHPGPSLSDISTSALVPCLSPPGTLTLDDFTSFTPLVKEELRFAIQTKRLSHGLSADMSDCASSSSDRPSEVSSGRREVRASEMVPFSTLRPSYIPFCYGNI